MTRDKIKREIRKQQLAARRSWDPVDVDEIEKRASRYRNVAMALAQERKESRFYRSAYMGQLHEDIRTAWNHLSTSPN